MADAAARDLAAAFEQQGVTEDDLIDFTPALRAEAVKIARQFRMGRGMFHPPSLAKAPDGTKGTFMAPSSNGGANIPGGAAADPETGWLYVASQHGYEVWPWCLRARNIRTESRGQGGGAATARSPR